MVKAKNAEIQSQAVPHNLIGFIEVDIRSKKMIWIHGSHKALHVFLELFSDMNSGQRPQICFWTSPEFVFHI